MLLLIPLIGVLAWNIERKLQRIDRRTARVEQSLTIIRERLGIGYPAELDQVYALVRKDKKIEAIKKYREITGTDLKDAKSMVDRLSGQTGFPTAGDNSLRT